ncbi:acetolactate decarboxylase [Scenedesmus sp. NREL 46B-D3]|nr:acetolactate decarboxylase [Scenedesmus sp. NREL 46B-D3]
MRQQSIVPLYIAETLADAAAAAAAAGCRTHIITGRAHIGIVDGLLEGQHSVAQVLAKGNMGLGTLDGLDGEVVVLDGVAYQQGTEGVKVLQGSERTPFMSVTMFSKTRSKQVELSPVSDLQGLEAQVKHHFRSPNVVYAVLVEGSFPYLKSRAVCKQEGHVALKDAAAGQVLSECTDECGVLVGFWCPPYFGSNLNVPGFHLHFLSGDRQRGGHLLQLRMEQGTAWLQEIHRAQVDLPFNGDFLDSSLLTQQASADLQSAEQDRS